MKNYHLKFFFIQTYLLVTWMVFWNVTLKTFHLHYYTRKFEICIIAFHTHALCFRTIVFKKQLSCFTNLYFPEKAINWRIITLFRLCEIRNPFTLFFCLLSNIFSSYVLLNISCIWFMHLVTMLDDNNYIYFFTIIWCNMIINIIH